MRTLQRHCSEEALPTIDTFLKRAKEARGFRRTQAVRDVVPGQRLPTVSATRPFPSAALRTWVQRCATEGTRGLGDRPRSGRPPTITCTLAQHRKRLVDHAPLEQDARSSPWHGRALATVWAPQPGVQRGRERGRGV